ncbi:EAL domain-containing protein [Thiotrichales bacterium 19X7-9]|nr:EAL domain-containing protein [Thiotrichales bacterium 19X7-9]
MNKPSYRVIVIDDTASIHDDFKQIFSQTDHDNDVNQLENLIFENNHTTQTKVLPLVDIQIDSAYSGEEGIKLVKQATKKTIPYSIAIVDIRMPGGIDGVQTAVELLQIEPNLQIVFCSAYSDYDWEDMITILKSPERWVILKKPFEVIEAQQLVFSLCEKWLLLLDMKNQIESQTLELKKQIYQLNQAKEEINFLAYYDSLTQLPNRLFFNELLKDSIAQASHNNTLVALFFLDIDNFKKINDTYGHNVGDKLLAKIAQRLKKSLRKNDILGRYHSEIKEHPVVCSRLGGDEFVITLKNLNHGYDVLTIAQRISNAISKQAFSIDKKNLIISTSIGIAVYPIDAKRPDTLLKNADIAMYQAKNSGKNRVVMHNKKLNNKIIHKHAMIQDIHQGLIKNEFFIEYQPKLSLKNREIVGAEALVRWKHPKKGLLMPGSFINVAEESDLIVHLDQYVLKKVCQQIQLWHKNKLLENIRISVNASARFLSEEHFVSIISNMLSQYKIPPQNLEIEITESKLIQSYDDMLKKLTDIRKVLGDSLKVSVDDFGVGYSSLSYLNELPIDIVKIDRSFISKVATNNDKQPIIKAIIELSHALNYHVIAEGVENQVQYDFLKQHQCDSMQGYLLSKSMPPDDFVEFIKNWQHQP